MNRRCSLKLLIPEDFLFVHFEKVNCDKNLPFLKCAISIDFNISKHNLFITSKHCQTQKLNNNEQVSWILQ